MAKVVAQGEINITANTKQAQGELQALQGTFKNLITGHMLMGWGSGLIDMVGDFIKQGADFEQTMLRIDRLAGNAGENVDALTKKAYQVDQLSIYSAQQVAEAMEQLSRENFTIEEILGGAIDASINLAGALDEDVVATANFFGQVSRMYADMGYSYEHIADVIGQAVLRSGRSMAEFQTGWQYIGPLAAQLKIPIEDSAGALAYLTSQGIKARSAGTGLRSLLLGLATDAEAFAAVGVTAFDPVTGAFVGLPSIIDQFHTLITGMDDVTAMGFLKDNLGTTLEQAAREQGMNDQEVMEFMSEMFDKPATSPLLALFKNPLADFEEFKKSMEDVGPMSEFMKALMDTTSGSIDRFGAAWENATRKMGSSLGSTIRPILDGLTSLMGMFANIPPAAMQFITSMIALAGVLMLLGGAIKVFAALEMGSVIIAGIGAAAGILLTLAAAAGLVVAALVFFPELFGKIGNAISGTFGFLGDLFTYLGQISDGAHATKEAFDKLPPGFQRTAHAIGTVVEAFADLWTFASGGDWERFQRRLPGELHQMWTGIEAIGEEMVAAVKAHWDEALALGGQAVFLTLDLVISVGISIIGKLGQVAGRLWDWLKGLAFNGLEDTGGDMRAAGQAAAGSRVAGLGGSSAVFGGANEITLGDLVINVGVQLKGQILQVVGRLWAWIKGQIGLTQQGPVTGMNGDSPIGALGGAGNFSGHTEPVYAGIVEIIALAKLAKEKLFEGASTFGAWIVTQLGELKSDAVDVYIDGKAMLGSELAQWRSDPGGKLTSLLGWAAGTAMDVTAGIIKITAAGVEIVDGATPGGKEGEGWVSRFIGSIGDAISSALSNTKDVFTGIPEAMGNLGGAIVDLLVASLDFKGDLGASRELGKTLGSALGAVIKTSLDYLLVGVPGTAGNEMATDLVMSVLGVVVRAFESIPTMGEAAVGAAGIVLAAANLGQQLFLMFVAGLTGFGEGLVTSMLPDDVAVGIGQLVTGLANIIMTGLEGIQDLGSIAGLKEMGGKLFGMLMGALVGGFSESQTSADPSYGGAAGYHTGGGGGMFDSLTTLITDGMQDLIDGLIEAGPGFVSAVIEAVTAWIPDDWGFVETAFSGLTNALNSVLQGALSIIRRIKDAVRGADTEGVKKSAEESAAWEDTGFNTGLTFEDVFGSEAPAAPGPEAGEGLGLVGDTYTYYVEADTTAAKASIEDLKGLFGGGSDGGGEPLTIPVELEVDRAKAAADLSGLLSSLQAGPGDGTGGPGNIFRIPLGVDTTAVQTGFDAVNLLGSNWAESAPFKGTFGLDVTNVEAGSNAAWLLGYNWDGQVFTASFSIDTSALDAAVEHVRIAMAAIAAMLPHSPAKEGPMAFTPSFDYIADSTRSAMIDAQAHAYAGMAGVASALDQDMSVRIGSQSNMPNMGLPGGGNTTIINNYAVTAEDLARLTADSQAGKQGLRIAAREFDMSSGNI